MLYQLSYRRVIYKEGDLQPSARHQRTDSDFLRLNNADISATYRDRTCDLEVNSLTL